MIFKPRYSATSPSWSSIRSNWLWRYGQYDNEPVLIWPALVTAISAIESSVSPERCDTTAVYPASFAISIASRSFGQSTDLVSFDKDWVNSVFCNTFFKVSCVSYEEVVTNQLNFTTKTFSGSFPTVPVVSSIPSSIVMIGYLLAILQGEDRFVLQRGTNSSAFTFKFNVVVNFTFCIVEFRWCTVVR